jgi:hypothetical protein
MPAFVFPVRDASLTFSLFAPRSGVRFQRRSR